MEAFRLQKKYPEVTKDEMFDLVNRFKWVLHCSQIAHDNNTTLPVRSRPTVLGA